MINELHIDFLKGLKHMSNLKFRAPQSARTKDLLDRALQLAKTSKYRHQHGAIIVKNGNVISQGVNYKVNNPRQITDPKTGAGIHAEVAAIKASRGADLNGAVIYVARVSKCGDPVMSKPCDRCQNSLREAGIKKVYYTIDSEMDL